MRGYIHFLTALLIFTDQIITIIYYVKNLNTFANDSIRRTLSASILIVPFINLAFSLYYLYPNHESTFIKHIRIFCSEIKEMIMIDVIKFHKDYFELRNKGSRVRGCIVLKIIGICIAFVPIMSIYWVWTIIKLSFMVMNFSFCMLAEFSALLSYSIYIAFFLWFRVMNCLNISIITECLGSSKYRLLDSGSKVRYFCILINGIQLDLQLFKCTI